MDEKEKKRKLKKLRKELKKESRKIKKEKKLEKHEKRKEKVGKDKKYFNTPKSQFFVSFLVALIVGAGVFIFSSFVNSLITFIGLLVLFNAYFFAKRKMKKYSDIKKMEEVFPDFISLMASNLRAGMTIDKALLMSSREEFAPLDKEILALGKDIITGKEINAALKDMSKRINSEEISKTTRLITSGITSGGNLSVLLEETASNMREKNFVRKRAASNVLMYIIFIFFAVSIGAPVLFGLSSVLVEVLTSILSEIPVQQTSTSLPFTLTSINISVNFIIYFVVVFLVVTDILASMILGLVSKGKEREGMKYALPLILISLGIFFTARIILLKYFSDFFA